MNPHLLIVNAYARKPRAAPSYASDIKFWMWMPSSLPFALCAVDRMLKHYNITQVFKPTASTMCLMSADDGFSCSLSLTMRVIKSSENRTWLVAQTRLEGELTIFGTFARGCIDTVVINPRLQFVFLECLIDKFIWEFRHSENWKELTWRIFRTSKEAVLTADSLDSPEPDAVGSTSMASGSARPVEAACTGTMLDVGRLAPRAPSLSVPFSFVML